MITPPFYLLLYKMLNAPILQKLTKRLENIDEHVKKQKFKPPPPRLESESHPLQVPKQQHKQYPLQEYKKKPYERPSELKKVKTEQNDQPSYMDSDSGSQSSPYVIKPRRRRYGGSMIANDRTYFTPGSKTAFEDENNLKKYEAKRAKEDDNKQKVKHTQSTTKRQEDSEQQQAVGASVFDEKFKRNFVLSILQKIGNEKEDEKLKILRRQAREEGVGFFDAKIWVIGYKIVFQVEDQLRIQGQNITEQLIKQRIANKIKSFWKKNPTEKRYYLLKLQSVVFKAFDIFENNPGVWFDNNINEEKPVKLEDQQAGSQSMANVYPESRKQFHYNPNYYAQQGLQGFSASKTFRRYDKNSMNNQGNEGFNRKSDYKKGSMPETHNFKPNDSLRSNKGSTFPVDFQVNIAEKLDRIFSSFIDKEVKDKANQFCMDKDCLLEIYQNFGSYNLQKKRSLSCDQSELKSNMENSGLYTQPEMSKVLNSLGSGSPAEVQKLLLHNNGSHGYKR